jgi:hypothetical protein
VAAVWCASHVTQLLGFGRSRLLEPLSSSGTGQALFTVRCASDSCPALSRIVRALFIWNSAFAVDRCAKDPLLRWCTGQSSGTLDSPVNYSGVALEKPECEEFAAVRSWCTRHCPWHTGQSGAPDQGTLGFLCFFLFEPQLDLFIVFVLNLYAPV